MLDTVPYSLAGGSDTESEKRVCEGSKDRKSKFMEGDARKDHSFTRMDFCREIRNNAVTPKTRSESSVRDGGKGMGWAV